ncbi:hypothetical protein NN561_014866 [Cricetulus griseus]
MAAQEEGTVLSLSPSEQEDEEDEEAAAARRAQRFILDPRVRFLGGRLRQALALPEETWSQYLESEDHRQTLGDFLESTGPASLVFSVADAGRLSASLELQAPIVLKMVKILTARQSSYFPTLNVIFTTVENALLEAQDVELHLSPLRRHIHGLQEAEFPQTRILIAPLFHTICLIWSHSKFYNTPARIIVLLQEFCNLFIDQARTYLSPEDLLKGEIEDALEKVQVAIGILKTFQNSFFKSRKRLTSYFTGNTEQRPWDFQSQLVFGRFNNFLARLIKIELLTIFGNFLEKPVVMEIFSPHYSTLLNMFNTELDVCKQLYDDHMKQHIGNLELLVQGYNKLKQNLLEVEYPLIEGELRAIDEQLKVAATLLTWQDDFWVYMERVQVATAELEHRVAQTQSNMGTIQQTMQAWAEWPLLPRREPRREAAFTLEDKGDLFAKKYKLIQEDGYKIHNLVEENRKLFRADPSLDSWKIYVEFIDDIVVEGFFQAILHDLDFFLMNTERQLKPAPFFQVQMLLMPPEIVFKPPLERDAGDGFYDLVEEMLCGSFRMSAQMERVAAHLDITNYQNDMDNMLGLAEVRQEIMNRVADVINKVLEFKSSLETYSYLWVDDRIDIYEALYVQMSKFDDFRVFNGWLKVDMKPFKLSLLNVIKKWSWLFQEHLLRFVTDSLNELQGFIKQTDAGLQRQLSEGDYNGLVDIMGHLLAVRSRQRATDKLFDPLKETIMLLESYGQKMPEQVYAQLEEKQAEFRERFRNYAPLGFRAENPYEVLDKAHRELETLEEEMGQMQDCARLFEVALPEYKQMKQCRSEIRLLKGLWDVIIYIREIWSLDKAVRSWDAYSGLEGTVKDMATSLRAIAELQSPALRDRHWQQLMETIGVRFSISDATTLADLLALQLHRVEEDVRDIVDQAVKELGIEKVITEVSHTWETLEFSYETHHRTGTPLLKSDEQLFETLEHNQVQLQTLLQSKYVEYFIEQVLSWQNKLNIADAVIFTWMEVQRTWSHLENIFVCSEDIRTQLVEDSRRFDGVDAEFKELMFKTAKIKNVLEATCRPHLYERLKDFQSRLSLCEKALAEYLETKRVTFPRFYFISSADLLDILSKGAQPKQVTRHLIKLFDNILDLQFEDNPEVLSHKAIGMFSKEKEYVLFQAGCECIGHVRFDFEVSYPKKVESWLLQLEQTMKETVRQAIAEAIAAYEEKPRELWILDFPAQVALTVSQIWWTTDVGIAFSRLEEGYETALKDFHKKQVVSPRAFAWLSQLRHQWEDAQKHCFVSICDAHFQYFYEYLGNSPRLVITPLTDRCYITLTQSLHLTMSGAPAGPAGTGKTETTKDLGRALGMMVYVFNCSEQMDYRSIGNIYKGLVQTGAWGCFDEFNRIAVEVLSVVAVQVKMIHDAIRNRKRRPCAMVAPDIELICEIMLVAEGFVDARSLARKFISLYTLCEELLSKQDHYDWGLRAVKSVLVVAGSLKRGDKNRPEDQVLMRALRDFNMPKIVTDDVPVFLGLVGDLFPALDVPRQKKPHFEQMVKRSTLELRLQPEESFTLKVKDLLTVDGRPCDWYVASWIDRRRHQSEKANLTILFDKYIPVCLEKLRTSFKSITSVPESSLVQTICTLLECLLTPENVPSDSPKEAYELYFVFACVWAFGGTLLRDQLSDYQADFSRWWHKEMKSVKFPSQGTIFDYYLDHKTKKFLPWTDKVPPLTMDVDLPLKTLLVHTPETTRLRYFTELLLEKGKPLMLVGNAGVGKTVFLSNTMASLSEDYIVSRVPFNYYTTSAMLQRILEKPLEKKAGRNYGPRGNKKLVYFIDDLNMPEVDCYGTVQPHALLRQHIDYGHWYDRQKVMLKEIRSCQYVACMNPMVGSFSINPRLQGADNSVLVQQPLIYCHFAHGEKDPCYMPVKDWEGLKAILREMVDNYNELHSAMHLVLFEDAMQHVTGAKNMPTVFLLTDAHVLDESFLVLINDLLASGDISDLFSDEDVDKIASGIRNDVRGLGMVDSRENCWAFFLARVQLQLKMVFCFSPVGHTLRVRARKFPAIVNCTTIDWFHAWPQEALVSVSRRFIEEIEGLEVGDLKARLASQEAELQLRNHDAEALITKIGLQTEKVSREKAIADAEERKVNLTELKTFPNPPNAVTNVTAAVMVLLAPRGRVPKDRSWKAAKIFMGKVDDFLQALINYDKEHIPENCLKVVNEQYLKDPEFNPNLIRTKSFAAAGLCAWVINIIKFYEVYCDVEPKRQALAQTNSDLAAATEKLEAIRRKLVDLDQNLSKLTASFQKATAEKVRCQEEVNQTNKTIDLANRLSEKIRWGQSIKSFETQEKTLCGDVLLTAAFVSYIGPFTRQYRRELVDCKWVPFLQQKVSLPITEGLDLIAMLTDDTTIATWNNEGLPNDRMSTENATILTHCERWPLMIDPQQQGIKWIKNKYGPELKVTHLGQKGFLNAIETALAFGDIILIENLKETMDPVLDSLLGRNTIKKGKFIRIGDKECEFNKNFRLILHTKLANPHYKPELQAQTTLLNFTVTEDGLEAQLLAEVVSVERPDLERLKLALTKHQNDFKIELTQLENDLLLRLSAAEGSFLDDTELVERLETTKATAAEIEHKAFNTLFHRAIEQADKVEDTQDRICVLIESITHATFLYASQALFEKDKLTFLSQMAFQILLRRNEIDPLELDFLLRFTVEHTYASPVDFLTTQSWSALKAVALMEEFRGLDRDVEGSAKQWRKWVESECPEKETLPQEWKKKSLVQKLIILRALRPDRMTYALRNFVEEKLGAKYVERTRLDLAKACEESNPATPVFFILSPGVDALKDLEVLGQGQELVAETALEKAATGGHWVILQNVHLVAKWLGTLEKLLEKFSQGSHRDYRVFMSAEAAPSPQEHIIPQGLLENSIKITNEPPTGMLASLHAALCNFDQDTLEMCSKDQEFKSILFSLCYFHACVAGRLRFGPQGWSRSYPFNPGDLVICANILYNYLEASPNVPWEDLRYLFGEIMYGGHITDAWDRKLCRVYLEEFMNPSLIEDELMLAPGFAAPPYLDYSGYHQYIEDKLPPESPVLYGLHPNAEIEFLTVTSNTLFRTLLEMQPRNVVSSEELGQSTEDKVKNILDDILERLPEEFNMAEIMQKNLNRSPYVLVCFQECERMNVLIREIRVSLQQLDLGLKGELTLSPDVEAQLSALSYDRVPDTWNKLAYPSTYGLAQWFNDLLLRCRELDTWTQDLALPAVVWLSGFFNPQSFLTAIMQTMARKNEWPLDRMCLTIDVTKKTKEDYGHPPREGAYIHGLHLEGARWDIQSGALVDARLKELTSTMPVIFAKAITVDRQETRHTYECPVYKTKARGLTYVWTFRLKSKEKIAKWVLAGVALLLEA